MEARDLRNKIIEKGSVVRYIGTLSIGEVDKISMENCQTWIRMDSSGLYYRSDYVEVLDKKDIPLKKSSFKKSLKQEVLSYKNLKKLSPTEISDHNDGPGYGGG